MTVDVPALPAEGFGQNPGESWYPHYARMDAAARRAVGVAALAADGTTDDAGALLVAAQEAVERDVPLILPAGAAIGIGSRVNLPAGLTVLANGALVRGLSAFGDFLLAFGADTTIVGHLRVQTAAGANVRGVSLASRTEVGGLTITAPAAGAGAGDLNDSALLILGATTVDIGQLHLENFDFAMKVAVSSGVHVDDLQIRNYVRGVYITDTQRLRVDGGEISGISPNENTADPGHNGVLVDATVDDGTEGIRVRDVVVKDAGEHGYRIGGTKRVRGVFFPDCQAINVGGCGFKSMPTVEGAYHQDVHVIRPIVEDAGQTPENAGGVLLQRIKHGRVDGLTLRRKTKTYSAGFGVEIQAADDVTVTYPDITDTLVAGYAVRHVLGDCTDVTLVGGRFTSTTGDIFQITYTGRTFRRCSIEGHPQADTTGTGYILRITNDGGGAIVGGSWLTWQSVSAADRQVTGILAGYHCDARAPFPAGTNPNFKPGSRWVDPWTDATNGGVIYDRVAGAWQRAINAAVGLTVVNHGSTAATPRPAGAVAVYWIGTVTPTNMTAADIYNGPAA